MGSLLRTRIAYAVLLVYLLLYDIETIKTIFKNSFGIRVEESFLKDIHFPKNAGKSVLGLEFQLFS